jgi:hypothetical protein
MFLFRFKNFLGDITSDFNGLLDRSPLGNEPLYGIRCCQLDTLRKLFDM